MKDIIRKECKWLSRNACEKLNQKCLEKRMLFGCKKCPFKKKIEKRFVYSRNGYMEIPPRPNVSAAPPVREHEKIYTVIVDKD